MSAVRPHMLNRDFVRMTATYTSWFADDLTDWWAGGVFDDSWQARLERRARQIKAEIRADAWWLENRLAYQFAELEREVGMRRSLPAMVTLS